MEVRAQVALLIQSPPFGLFDLGSTHSTANAAKFVVSLLWSHCQEQWKFLALAPVLLQPAPTSHPDVCHNCPVVRMEESQKSESHALHVALLSFLHQTIIWLQVVLHACSPLPPFLAPSKPDVPTVLFWQPKFECTQHVK